MTAKAPRDYGQDLAYGLAAQNDPRISKALDLLYPGHVLIPASKAHDRIGIDMWLIRPGKPGRVGVQIKSARALFIGVFAVELIADAATATLGWTLDPAAELLVQLYPNKLLVLHLPTLSHITRENLDEWQRTAKHTTTQYAGGRRVLSLFKYVTIRQIKPALLLELPWPEQS
jgi:hypothetical protein